MYLILLLINTFMTSLYMVLSSKIMKAERVGFNFTIAAVHLAASLFLLCALVLKGGIDISGFGVLAFGWLLFAVFLKVIGKQMHYYSYANAEVAYVTVFSSFIPLFGIVFGVLLLEETVSSLELLGAFIIFFSVYFMFHEPSSDKQYVKEILRPFRELGSKPIMFAFLSTIPPALSAVYIKKSAMQLTPLMYAYLSTTLIGLSALFVEYLIKDYRGILVEYRKVSIEKYLLIGGIFATAQYVYVVLLTIEEISHTLCLLSIGIIFQIILAYWILSERSRMRKKLFLGSLIVLASVLVDLGG